MSNTTEHLKNIKLLTEIYKGKKFYVECYPTDAGALCFPNTNLSVKEIDLPNFTPALPYVKEVEAFTREQMISAINAGLQVGGSPHYDYDKREIELNRILNQFLKF